VGRANALETGGGGRKQPSQTATYGRQAICDQQVIAPENNPVLAHSTIADLAGIGIDQPRESEQGRDTERACNEEGR
jgi:hypothetical protein